MRTILCAVVALFWTVGIALSQTVITIEPGQNEAYCAAGFSRWAEDGGTCHSDLAKRAPVRCREAFCKMPAGWSDAVTATPKNISIFPGLSCELNASGDGAICSEEKKR